MSEAYTSQDHAIFNEMMSHPAIYTHPRPKIIAVIGNADGGIAQEILKHPGIGTVWHITESQPEKSSHDLRYQYQNNQAEWLAQLAPHSLDILIVATQANEEWFKHYHNALHSNGIMIQQCDSAFAPGPLQTIHHALHDAGFSDVQTLNFPQTIGWRSAIMAHKHGLFRRIREKDIFNKTFQTHYYNHDVHKAALALPEFMRAELQCTVGCIE